MQTLPSPGHDETPTRGARVGDLVKVRGQRWRVLDVQVYEDCRLVSVIGIGPANGNVERRFLQPFEAIGALERPAAARFVSPRRWRRACRTLLAASGLVGGLRAVCGVHIDLLPHQLEPALAIVRGLGSRVLLADDVGLGKTIQAALIVAELRGRGIAERVLILTPAGLREQWAAELNERFGMTAAVIDHADISRRVARLPVGLNPWSTMPVAVASLDYVKRTEVLHAVMSCRWDILIVDEAHTTANDGDRRAAVSALAARAPYVFLLTATPHSGEPHAFDALCRTGGHGDPMLIFSRRRADVRLGARRRVHHIHVRSSPAEARMHAMLAELTHAVRREHSFEDVWLPLSVLHKRAYSSAKSLELSLSRRSGVSEAPDGQDGARQISLPLDSGEFEASDEPPELADTMRLEDRALEVRLHKALAQAAGAAALNESKIGAIFRLLQRLQEPVIIFTEYRDTLLHIKALLKEPASILHGGLTRSERSAALADFVRGPCRILLATDTAGEGLNLQSRCRCVINLELPWNPMRLEQRIGRVDRIGQSRTVHAFHLIGYETGEAGILERLKSRLLRARRDIAIPDSIIASERSIAQFAFGQGDVTEAPSPVEREIDSRSDRILVSLSEHARAEAARLSAIRIVVKPRDEAVTGMLEAEGTWIARARLAHTRAGLGSRLIVLFRVESEDGHGRIVDAVLVSFGVTLSTYARRPRSVDRTACHYLAAALAEPARIIAEQRGSEFMALWRALVNTRLERERRIIGAMDPGAPPLRQPGLFDNRTHRQHAAALATSGHAARTGADRLARWLRAGHVTPRPARLMLVLVP